MTLAEARDARFAAKKDVAEGTDPLSKKTNAQTVCR